MDHEVQREQLEHLEGLCKARYLRDYEEHIEALRPLFGWIEKTSGRDSEQSDTAVAELIVKLFTAARVGFERLLEACEGVHISQRVNTSCLNVIACVCGWILRAYLPGRDILSAPLPRQTAEQQIIRSGRSFTTTKHPVSMSHAVYRVWFIQKNWWQVSLSVEFAAFSSWPHQHDSLDSNTKHVHESTVAAFLLCCRVPAHVCNNMLTSSSLYQLAPTD